MRVEILIRGRYEPLVEASARHVGANAWEVRIPRTPRTERLFRRWGLGALDDAVLVIDGIECLQVVGTAARPDELVATALLP